jgi:tripartite ATP-independent transporter DctM subunit
MNSLLVIILVFLALIFISIPVGYAMLVTAGVYFFFLNTGIPATQIAQATLGALSESFTLIAIPLFLLAGALLNRSGMTERIVNFALAIVGHLRGGLGHAVVVANVVMAGMSGSATSDAAGIGSIMIPALKNAGYTPADAAALNAAAATLGPIIPPSIAMVIFSSLSGVSLGRLLLAGVLPGFVVALFLMANVYVSNPGGEFERPPFDWRRLAMTTRDAVLCLAMPGIIMGGMVGGVYTPTEGAAAAVLYTLFVGAAVYRTLDAREVFIALGECARLSGSILIVVAASASLSWIMTVEHAGEVLGGLFASFGLAHSPHLLMLAVAVFVLILGTAMEETTMLVLLVPVLFPICRHAGVDAVQFGIVFILATMMGLITPPVGLTMFIACRIAGATINQFTAAIIRPFLALVLALFVCAVWDGMVLFLPRLVMG